jgi:hypothetical protein
MAIQGVGPTGSSPRDTRQTSVALPAATPGDTENAQAKSPTQVEISSGAPSKPLGQVSDDLKGVVLEAQDASGASNESLAQLFRVLIDLLAEQPPGPKTKLDV